MQPDFGKVEHPRLPAQGNRALLVVVNSVGSYWDYSIVEETVLCALDHFGLPYRVLDLCEERLTPALLENCACLLLAQSRVGAFLTKAENVLLAAAVREGMGLVSFDNDLRNYDGAYLELFGFEEINPHPFASNLLRVREQEHYVTAMQRPGEIHRFDAMVTALAVGKYRRDVVPLADCILGKEQLVYIRHITPWSAFEPRNWPAAFAARWGRGKAVQFTVSPRLWKRQFFGHVRGLDDLFWRSIVWCARKPFIANMIPPFVTMSFDDCSGRHDFRYVDAASSRGYVPMPSLFLERVDERLFPRIREQQRAGKAEYNTHAVNYYDHMYHAYGRGPYTACELDERFAREDAFWAGVGAPPTRTVRFHCGEMGVNALPYLKRRGRCFLNPALQTGLLKADMCMADGYYPYNLQNCYYDYLPDDHWFFAFNSMLARFQEDFLGGATVNLLESPVNDVKKAGQSLAFQISNGLRAGFHADVVTHEQKFENLSLTEWEAVLEEGDRLTAGMEKIMAGHDEIAAYLRNKDGVRLVSAAAKDGVAFVRLQGNTDVPLRLSVFTDCEEGIQREYLDVGPFGGVCSMEINGG